MANSGQGTGGALSAIMRDASIATVVAVVGPLVLLGLGALCVFVLWLMTGLVLWPVGLLGLAAAVAFIQQSWFTVDAGRPVMLKRIGMPLGTRPPGLNTKIPWFDEVVAVPGFQQALDLGRAKARSAYGIFKDATGKEHKQVPMQCEFGLKASIQWSRENDRLVLKNLPEFNNPNHPRYMAPYASIPGLTKVLDPIKSHELQKFFGVTADMDDEAIVEFLLKKTDLPQLAWNAASAVAQMHPWSYIDQNIRVIECEMIDRFDANWPVKDPSTGQTIQYTNANGQMKDVMLPIIYFFRQWSMALEFLLSQEQKKFYDDLQATELKVELAEAEAREALHIQRRDERLAVGEGARAAAPIAKKGEALKNLGLNPRGIEAVLKVEGAERYNHTEINAPKGLIHAAAAAGSAVAQMVNDDPPKNKKPGGGPGSKKSGTPPAGGASGKTKPTPPKGKGGVKNPTVP